MRHIELAIIDAAEVAAVDPHMARGGLSGGRDPYVVPAHFIIVARGILLPKTAEAEIADDDVLHAAQFDRAAFQGGSTGRAFECGIRARADDADLLQLVAGLLVGQFTEIDVARELDHAWRTSPAGLLFNIQPFDGFLKLLGRADDHRLAVTSTGSSSFQRSKP